eukprot:901347-Rhodomonas_salina.1
MSEAGVAEKSPSNSPAKKKSKSAAQAGRSAQTKGKQTAGHKNGRGLRGRREEGDGDGDEMQQTDIPPLRPQHHAAGAALSQPDNGEEGSSGPAGGSKRGRPDPPPRPLRSPEKPARAEEDVPEPASWPAQHSMPAVHGTARVDYSCYKGALLDWHSSSSCLVGKRRDDVQEPPAEHCGPTCCCCDRCTIPPHTVLRGPRKWTCPDRGTTMYRDCPNRLFDPGW